MSSSGVLLLALALPAQAPDAPTAPSQAANSPPASAAPTRLLQESVVGYAAKIAASARFVSGRTLDSVWAEELSPSRPLERMIRPLLRLEVDEARRTVTARLGEATATAVATSNLGCVLAPTANDVEALRARAAPGLADLRPPPQEADWPTGERIPAELPAGVDRTALRAAVDTAFVEPADRPPVVTRAVVVVHRRRIVAERYGTGVHAHMPLPGWSMSKTLVHALLGVRVQQGELDPTAPLPVPAWRSADDGRERIRLHDLLAMRGGLAWREDYDDPQSDALRMLFRTGDAAQVYANQPLEAAPGARFVYSSGATNLLCLVLRRSFADDRDYWAFPSTQLFARLGMRTAMLEADASGTFVGSSFGFASARDWARLGLLYADDGQADGVPILPPGWVAAARRSASGGDGRFGLHLWLDEDPDGDGPARREWPDLPPDVFHMDGHEGQYVVVVPSRQLVLVRLGCTKNGGFDLRGLVRKVLAALPD